MKKIALTVIHLLLGTNLLFGQGGTAEQDRAREQVFAETKGKVEDEEYRKGRYIKSKSTTKLSAEDSAKLSPPLEDSARYAQFLNNKKTGIAKLLQSPICDRRVININDTKCLEAPQIIGNGSIYSFSERNHVDSLDIMLKGEELFVFNLGLMTEFGDVALETFDFIKDAKALKKFSIKKEISEISIQKKQFAEGVEIASRIYKNRVSAKADTTYLLRSVKFRYIDGFGRGGMFSEIIVAFRVIRKDIDGSIILVWKEL